MDGAAADCGAFGEAVVFLTHFRDLPDPRQRGKVTYPLDEVLLLCLLAVLAGAETIVDIARFGDKKIGLLRRFRPFRDGTPAHDHLGDILATLDAEQFQRCFVSWVASLMGAPTGVIAIDGKTVRRSYRKGKAPIHMVSAFAARQRLVLGQVKVAENAGWTDLGDRDPLANEAEIQKFLEEAVRRGLREMAPLREAWLRAAACSGV
jgi:hypothetical protein